MLNQTFTCPSTSTIPYPHRLLLLLRSSILIPSFSFFPICRTTATIFLKQKRESITVLPSLRPAGARRRLSTAGYEDEEQDYNEELAMLEAYTQSSRNEVLLVKAIVDLDIVEVLIFKGFSSCLSYGTSPDPSRSVLPARAVIKNIDRVKGPFNPSNIEYIEKGLTWETFKNRITP